eukprot:scaffold159017_cov37-Prasinocladus_malaysianus.AAC.1
MQIRLARVALALLKRRQALTFGDFEDEDDFSDISSLSQGDNIDASQRIPDNKKSHTIGASILSDSGSDEADAHQTRKSFDRSKRGQEHAVSVSPGSEQSTVLDSDDDSLPEGEPDADLTRFGSINRKDPPRLDSAGRIASRPADRYVCTSTRQHVLAIGIIHKVNIDSKHEQCGGNGCLWQAIEHCCLSSDGHMMSLSYTCINCFGIGTDEFLEAFPSEPGASSVKDQFQFSPDNAIQGPDGTAGADCAPPEVRRSRMTCLSRSTTCLAEFRLPYLLGPMLMWWLMHT